jgi:hypothetical protein
MTIAAERTLSVRELNRALLARQGLLAPCASDVPGTLKRIGGIQAQYAPSMYVGLWSRMRSLARDELTLALERRSAVQATLMRVTIHLVAREDYWPFALATRRARRVLWLRANRGAIEEAAMIEAAALVAERLADTGTLQRKQLDELVGRPHSAGVGLWIDLVRVPPSGTWEKRRADLYGLAEDWLGSPQVTDDEAADQLVLRYLVGFGPASRGDVASYTGLGKKQLGPLLDGLSLRRFRSESGEELLDVARAPLPDPDTPAPVRFLPTWDATLLVHARRTGLLPEEHRAKIFHVKNPHSLPTFLVDGVVAGTWRYDDERIELDPFGPLDAADLRQLRDEGERLAAFHD